MVNKRGALLVPVFAFGANDRETCIPGFQKLNQFLSKKVSESNVARIISDFLLFYLQFRVVFPFFYGLYGTPLPRKTPVDVVVGAPVPPPKFEGEITKEVIEEYHTSYVKALVELYETNKAKFCSQSIPLEILGAR